MFHEAIKIAPSCNKVLRKRFLKSELIGLIPTGGCSFNNKYSKKMWLMHMEQTDKVKVKHCRNGRDYRLPQLRNFSVDCYFPQTNTIYEFIGCFWQGHTCHQFLDVSTMSGDTDA